MSARAPAAAPAAHPRPDSRRVVRRIGLVPPCFVLFKLSFDLGRVDLAISLLATSKRGNRSGRCQKDQFRHSELSEQR